MVLSLYCTAELTDFCVFCVFYFVFLNHCISVFMLLCFVFRCSIGNIATIISYRGRPARWTDGAGLSFTFYMHIYIFSWQINSAAAAGYGAVR